MREVFAALWPVLRDDGTCWVNIADSYAATGKSGGGWQGERWEKAGMDFTGPRGGKWKPAPTGLKPKDLMGIPWRLAMALQADGWYLRSSIIWAKPNPMPESIRDRPTRSHEYVFLLSKRERYFYDAEAIREPYRRIWDGKNGGSMGREDLDGSGHKSLVSANSHRGPYPLPRHGGANKRDVWSIVTQPYPQAHFATMPVELALTCIKAGTSLKGCCGACGAAWVRITENQVATPGQMPGYLRDSGRKDGDRGGTFLDGRRTTIGWQPGCTCTDASQPVPCTVLDPFGGAGTTAVAARQIGRHAVLIEQKPEYIELIRQRLRMPTEHEAASSGDTPQLRMF
jgi:DNA modification methylase